MFWKFSMEGMKPREKAKPVFYPEYIFRITDGNTPFNKGSWSKSLTEYSAHFVYVSPVLYTWIHHWFENKGDRVYALSRPKTLVGDTMCCGLNSHYHFCFTKHPELLPKMQKAVLTKNYSDPEIQRLFKEHESRVKEKFGKRVSDLKGGDYLGTLKEFDTNHPARDNYQP